MVEKIYKLNGFLNGNCHYNFELNRKNCGFGGSAEEDWRLESHPKIDQIGIDPTDRPNR